MANSQPVKLGWVTIPAVVVDGIVAAPSRSRAINEDNGQIIGVIEHFDSESVYTSHMPKSAGEQRRFINAAMAKQWVTKRYAEAEGKPEAPQLPVEG